MNAPFDVVFNDEALLIIDKQAKLPVQPAPGETHTLTGVVEKTFHEHFFPCHRLDRETTGLLIYARTSQAQQMIAAQFRKRTVSKKYYAFVKGEVRRKQGTLRGEVIDREGRAFGERPRPAEARYRVLGRRPGFTVLEMMPRTGRTNQLRIQLARAGHPILGERKYARGKDFSIKFGRLALHAFYLCFIHPLSRERVEVQVDMAGDMKRFLEKHTLPG